ncbi:MAG: anthranilate synthase component I [Candidatus Omnitrophica bacterium CG07_land_8_20_14_0_80_50_8]|nr:MAG: anthranilate synthase component I [Candidatus Omnitrophica bacterium CG07_land_8_20_14_0_80_50_8]
MSTYTPGKKEFLALAKKGNLIPVYREILADLETPVSCFMKVGDRPYSYLLESVEGGEKIARYSFIGGEPSLVFKSKGREITRITPGASEKRFTTKTDPLAELQSLLKKYRPAPVKGLPPFSGGAVGYLGYDTVRFIERIPDKNKDVYGIPDSLFIFTDTLFVFDHLKQKIKVILNVCLDDFTSAQEAYAHALEKIDDEIRRLVLSPASPRLSARGANPARLEIRSNFTKRAFEKVVQKAKRYIKIGDIIQVVPSQSFRMAVRSEPLDIYRALRSINPSPYMFYLNCDGFHLVGASPEIHVRCEDRKAVVRPIAGTRPRGRDARQDQRLEKELLADPKERAEHLMLVDLARNDLGRVCDFKTVKVPTFMTVERYSHVMHIVSHVEGLLKKGKTIFDLLRATFPAGTVSGAPKVRAMEIIDELENQKRGFYAGVVGYFSYSGNLDSCIAIRTILVKDGTAFVQAGGGVVADSVPAKEYQETVNKAKALVKAIESAEKGATQ